MPLPVSCLWVAASHWLTKQSAGTWSTVVSLKIKTFLATTENFKQESLLSACWSCSSHLLSWTFRLSLKESIQSTSPQSHRKGMTLTLLFCTVAHKTSNCWNSMKSRLTKILSTGTSCHDFAGEMTLAQCWKMKRQWWNSLNYDSSQFPLPCPQPQISLWKHQCHKNTWMPSTTCGYAQSTSRNSLMKRVESTLGNTHCSYATWGVPSAMWPLAVQHLSPAIWKLNMRDLSLIVGHVARNTPALKCFANMPKKSTACTNSGMKNVTEHLCSRASWPNMQPVIKKQALTCVMNVETCTRLFVLWESIWRYTASCSTYVRNVVTLWRRRGFCLNTCWAGTQKPGDTCVVGETSFKFRSQLVQHKNQSQASKCCK